MKLKKLVPLSIILMASYAVHAMEPEVTEDSALFKIVTSDEKEFKLPYGLLKLSPTIQQLIEDLCFNQEVPIPLPTIDEANFDNVKKALELFSPIAKKYDMQELQSIDAEQDLKFWTLGLNTLGLSNLELINLVAALDYLGMQPLVDAGLRVLSYQKLSPDDIASLPLLGGPKLEEFWQESKKLLESAYRNNSFSIPFKQISNYRMDEENNRLIIWSGYQGNIEIWSLSNLEKPLVLPHKNVLEVKYSKDYLISWSVDDSTLKLWDRKNLSEIPTPIKQKNLSGVGFDYENKHLAASSYEDGVVTIWNLQNLDETPQIVNHPEVTSAFFDNNKLITWSAIAGTVRIWLLDKLQQDAEFSEIVSSTNAYEVSTTTDGKAVQLAHHRDIEAPILSSDGNNLIVIAPTTHLGTLATAAFLWDMNDLEQPRTIIRESRPAYFPESNLLFTYKAQQITLWDLKTLASSSLEFGATKLALYDNYLIAWNFKPGIIKIWDVSDAPQTIKEIASLEHPKITNVTISPDKHYLVTASQRPDLKIWNLKNLTEKPFTMMGLRSMSSYITNNLDLIDVAYIFNEPVKIWDLTLLPFIENPTTDQILLYLFLHFSDESKGLPPMSDETKQQFKATFDGLPQNMQNFLRNMRPNTVEALIS